MNGPLTKNEAQSLFSNIIQFNTRHFHIHGKKFNQTALRQLEFATLFWVIVPKINRSEESIITLEYLPQ
jgi:hypothetical protein